MHLVVFDVDGTLVESEDFDGTLYARAIRNVLKIDVDTDWSGYRLLFLDIVDTSSSKDEVSTKPGQAQPSGRLRDGVTDCGLLVGRPARALPGA